MSTFAVAGITQLETIVNVGEIPIRYQPLTSAKNSIHIAAGGDAYNETLALKWLGDEALLLSLVGRDQDMSIFNPAGRKVTISTEYMMPLLEEMPMQVILCDKERRQQIFEDIKGLREVNYDMSMVTPLIARCDMLVLSNANFCRPFIKVAQRYHRPIAVNVHEYLKEKETYNKDFLKAASVLYFSDDTIHDDPFAFVEDIA